MARANFFSKTSILISSNMISGILVFTFTIILSRELGSKAMGLYQLIMPLYTILIFITGGGISVAMSRISAEKKAEGKIAELYRIVKVVCFMEILWSIIIIGAVMLFAEFLSKEILGDSRTYISILFFCPGLIFTSISSTYRGTYFGMQKILAPAIIEIFEKLIKIILMYITVSIIKKMSMEYAVDVAFLSLSLGEFVSFVLFSITFALYKRSNHGYGKCDNDLQLLYNVIKITLPISMEGIISALFSTLTAIIIPKRLGNIGISYEDALGFLGRLQGMAINIALFPMLVITSFNMLLIPNISSAIMKGQKAILKYRINSAIEIAAAISFLTSAVILCDPTGIGLYFYNDQFVGKLLSVIAPALPIVYIELVSYAILNGLGQHTRLLRNSIIIQTIDIILLYIFVGTKAFNIYGYVVNMTTSALIGIYINYKLIIRVSDIKIDWVGKIVIPMLCGIITYIMAANFIFKITEIPFSIILSVILYVIIYSPVHKYINN
jgi:stage V sporulation protein B